MDETPTILPTSNALVDSAAVVAALRADAQADGYAVVEFAFDTLGALSASRIVESDLADQGTASVLRAVESNVRPQRALRDLPGNPEQQSRAFVGHAAAAGFLRRRRRSACRPLRGVPPQTHQRNTAAGDAQYPLGRSSQHQSRSRAAANRRARDAAEPNRSGDGRARGQELGRRSSGRRRAEGGTLAVFQPAVINRKASAVEVTFPVRLELDPGTPGRGRPRR